MDGVHPPRCVVCGMAVVCAAAVHLGRGVVRALLTLVQYSSVLLSCRALFVAGCVVRCGACVSVLLCVVGYPLSAPPSSWWWVGPLWVVGWHDDVGWHCVEGRGVLVWWVARM